MKRHEKNVQTKVVSLTISTTKFRAASVMREVWFFVVVCSTKGIHLILGVGTEVTFFYSLICRLKWKIYGLGASFMWLILAVTTCWTHAGREKQNKKTTTKKKEPRDHYHINNNQTCTPANETHKKYITGSKSIHAIQVHYKGKWFYF